jgi:hypothetical protein
MGTQNLNGDGGWVCDEFCTHDGYEDEYGDGSNMMRRCVRCYNPPLTSLVGINPRPRLNYNYDIYTLLLMQNIFTYTCC